jgi:plasmid stabilization system protein ParE
LKIVVSREALADFERLRAFLTVRNPRAARRAVETINGAIRSLEVFPERGRPAPVSGLRELIVPFGRAAYVVRYALFAELDELVILRIWHGREQRL